MQPDISSARQLKIAFVYDALFPYQKGGAERRYFELARRLKGRHDIHYITWKHWPGPSVVQHDGITLYGIGEPREMYGTDGKRTIREAALFSAALGPALARQQFDVIDCSATPYLPLYTCWAGSRVSRTHVIATWHEYWGKHWHEYLGHRRAVAHSARLLETGSVRFADSRVAVSAFTAERMPGRAAHVVENGIDFNSVRARDPYRPRDGAHVITVGRLIDEKQIDVLLGAIARVRHHIPNVRCEIIGDGPDRGALEVEVARLGLEPHVTFLGHVDETTLDERLSAARLFALPSVREGFGISVVEALARGTVPIVAQAPHSAASTLVEDGISGIVCQPTADAFAGAITTALADEERLGAMSRAAELHSRRYDWDAIALRMERLYHEAAARERPSILNGARAGARRLTTRTRREATAR